MGGTLLQKQGDEWVVIGYHSKRLPKSAKNFGVTELELTGLLVNIHGFMQLLHNRYFEVLVDHKAIEYMIKSKTESPTTRLKTLLLKLSKYTIDLKYQKGSEMHTSDALSRLHNFTDTPDQKDIIPLNFLQHLTPHYTEHYSLLPLNSQQLTPVQTAVQRMSEKHPDFEIEPVNTIRPLEIEYTQMPRALVPIDTPLSIIHKHIPRQSDIDKIVRNIETHVIHSLELPISGTRSHKSISTFHSFS